MHFDLEATNRRVGEIVRTAPSPSAGLVELLRFMSEQSPALPPLFQGADAEAEVARIAGQVKRITQASPIPSAVTTLYFGLFESQNEEEKAPCAGLYVSGVERFDPDDLDTLCDPLYYPEERYLHSGLLDRVVSASLADKDNGQFIYYMMMGVGGILAKFAAKKLALKQKVIVGFDDGDVIEV